MISRQVPVNIRLTPKELAVEFSNMDAREQAEFFNEVAMAVEPWAYPFVYQLQYIADSGVLSTKGRLVMRHIGEYSEVGEVASAKR